VTSLATPRRAVAALFLAALVLAAASNCPGLGPRRWESVTTAPPDGVVHVPCRPVVAGGRAECTGIADIPPNTRLVIYEPATESEAAMVRRQLLDARGGTP
jgi:hypothetical protein